MSTGSPGPAAPWRGQLWAIVLAGGEGRRLKSLTRRICGDERPKQYVPVLGDRTLLRQTLDRVALEIPLSRTVIVTLRDHARYFTQQVGVPLPHVLAQPTDRGTAAGILLPAHWVHHKDPDATVAIFPSDHFVPEEVAFMTHVARVAAWVREHPDRLVLLGAEAISAEVEYGWIERGEPLDPTGEARIWGIRHFWEKPSEQRAQTCLATGCLWNTFVMVGKAATFLRAGHEAAPDINDRLILLAPFFGGGDETWAMQQAYALMPTTDFSRSVLGSCPPFLAVSALPRMVWSDLGNPQRVFEVLGHLRSLPSWAVASDLAAS